jgi:AcrR family transcriptional regulator
MPAENPAEEERGYHHGDLRHALIAAAAELIEEQGLDAVSVRALARRLGVSPGAPFRHFQSRTALLTAVAEEAQDRLLEAVAQARRQALEGDPLSVFRSIGEGYLRWAFANPTHFQVISTRAVIDYDSPALRQRNDALRLTMSQLMESAASQGHLRPGDVENYILGARALAYGLARMHIDGQFASWGVDTDQALGASVEVLDQFIAAMRA